MRDDEPDIGGQDPPAGVEENWPTHCGVCQAPPEMLGWDPVEGYYCTSCGAADSDE